MEQLTMVRCPVCGQPVNPEEAPSYQYKGETYYFRCPRCLDRFLADPELFVGVPRGENRAGKTGGCGGHSGNGRNGHHGHHSAPDPQDQQGHRGASGSRGCCH